ncbi:hypothetical protein GCHA_4446 [Paraglaciecola chathamensis S18K6]|uniref:Uncharacterized protein n=1 Tax=Paraglaciecola chathamensis S18K6 TaxID=1127672 RepID=A0AAV3V6H3_9ALTE|nr:hypothetical protein GCHA_4446 [Paraglaciecola chathamensis S18K6]
MLYIGSSWFTMPARKQPQIITQHFYFRLVAQNSLRSASVDFYNVYFDRLIVMFFTYN